MKDRLATRPLPIGSANRQRPLALHRSVGRVPAACGACGACGRSAVSAAACCAPWPRPVCCGLLWAGAIREAAGGLPANRAARLRRCLRNRFQARDCEQAIHIKVIIKEDEAGESSLELVDADRRPDGRLARDRSRNWIMKTPFQSTSRHTTSRKKQAVRFLFGS